MQTRIRVRAWLWAIAFALLAAPDVSAQGLYLPGGGAAHLSMGGASTATPVDAIGALYWNPAAIGRLGHSEAAIGGAFLFPDIHLDSGPASLMPGRPAATAGRASRPTSASCISPTRAGWSYGLGLNTLAWRRE